MTDTIKGTPGGKTARALIAVARLALFALLLAGPASGAGSNLEEKLRYERSLEQKVEEVLANLLGPGKSRVMIRAVLDFSSKESVKFESERSESEKIAALAPKPEQPAFGWQDINKPAGKELLPGFFDNSPQAQQQGVPVSTYSATATSYQRETTFPQSMIRRLTVSLVISEDVSEADAQKVRQVLTELLALDSARGDEIMVMRARFAPIWYTSEMLGTLVKYGIIALIAIVGMGIVSLGFLKMAAAMRGLGGTEDTRIRMELGAAPRGGETIMSLEEGEAPAGKAEKPEPAAPPPAEPDDGLVFDIKPDKLEILIRLLARDEPADIAIIAVHLPSALRSRFLSMLPPETGAEVLANIAKVRFMDPDALARIKDELERKLSGAVGGYEKAVRLIESVGHKEKVRLLETMARTHPDIAARVRERVLLLEDVEDLGETDFALVAGSVPVEIWAAAAPRLSEAGMKKLKDQLTEGAWRILEQTLKYGGVPEDKIDDAAGRVLGAALKLLAEGRIKRPAPAAPPAAIAFSPPAPRPAGQAQG